MEDKIQEGCFCRVKNRIDIIGKVRKINGKFICLEIPQFKGNIEYLVNLVEIINDETFQEKRDTEIPITPTTVNLNEAI